LRTHKDDKNVMPEELAAYARGQGYMAEVRINGNVDLLRLLLSNGIPILIESWAVPEPDNGMGHYRLLTGYNDEGQYWIAYDSYIAFGLINPDGDYRGIRIPYNDMDHLWSAFNRLYVLVYPTAQAPLIQSVLGATFDQNAMWQQALTQAQTTVQQQPDDAFGWFNLGSDQVAFKNYASAVDAYDHARQLGLPWRMMWYQYGPFQAYYQVGRYADIMALTDEVLAKTESIEEIHLWRGWALKAQGQIDAARQSWQKALDLNPNFAPARDALAQP
jgi:tetratricopeptide (TPR) repeat protein